MRRWTFKGTQNRKASALALAGVVCLAGLSGCISALPPLRDDQTATISGNGIYYLQPSDYVASMMSRAAEMTVDHGYRYFVIVSGARGSQSAIQPGHDLTIKLYSADEISPGARGIWDAQEIMANGPPRTVAQSAVVPNVRTVPPVYSPPSATSPASQPPSQTPSWLHPHCTDSVCTW